MRLTALATELFIFVPAVVFFVNRWVGRKNWIQKVSTTLLGFAYLGRSCSYPGIENAERPRPSDLASTRSKHHRSWAFSIQFGNVGIYPLVDCAFYEWLLCDGKHHVCARIEL